MSPTGDTLRTRCRNFPGNKLLNRKINQFNDDDHRSD
jgi:hypothetical protein